MATLSVNGHFALLLIWIGIWLSECNDIGPSLDDDLLSPYPYGHSHGPSHSHRHVRDCQSVVHGNVTHQTWPASNHTGVPVAESKVFISDVPGTTRWVTGHITVVHDPLRTVSVLEPGGPGGCGMNQREVVEETARAGSCLYAQNGGFFDTRTGECLGNLVSDGVQVRDSKGLQNAQFGIRRDGTLVFGYLSEEDVQEEANPFVQLVSGVVWLLRNSQVYINQSIQAECDTTQETGNFRHFVDVVSARTAVGHDEEGKLILFHIDGQTDHRGMNLWEVADFLKGQGVINAINLDGGGSSTYVANGSLASYPSDHCVSNPMWRCPRRVSTILCVHQPQCQPEDCSGHGTCINGHCQCQEGWSGTGCDTLVCQPPACGAHGVCTQDGCACDAGWRGKNCSQVCDLGFYGDGCNQTCTCTNGGLCDTVHGDCSCPIGFRGDSCEQECPLGLYGLDCGQKCQCQDMCPCDPVTGSCNALFQGEKNQSIHRAGHCLANQMFATWSEEEAHKSKPYLSEQCWLIVTGLLTSLLLSSLVGHLIMCWRSPAHHPGRVDYSYVPLTEIGGACSSGDRGKGSQPSRGVFEMDSDSQDELWSGPR
ncbi:N-acetylglucosamine-1-phosphodiester alpha-N-acetylglucosaminidase isoform X1 [Oncorhynchus mykiss]|uniref:N-acetylglucosamine-1-phosphodiester alpha-N-acetylglucosaminidase n=1 Tax=Oncorhynchus mykiss TaxID=8022 RepID=A0A8C7NQP9_ONCMY|nr:N-acetylglucosamine-1-phosphodiester alpha-N-acetylglucosaminidase isoform X1 [Oncorhynchus mykiss]